MPTKPLTQPLLWADDAVYTTGPFIGSANKVVPAIGIAAEGHRPGALFPTAAEHENSQQNRLTQLARWVFLGTFSPDPDAHLVETDSTGRAGVHGLDVINGVDEIAVNISGSNTFVPTVLASCTTGATVFQADIGSTAGTCYSGNVGTNTGTVFNASLFTSPSGAAGLRVFVDAMSGAYCADLTNAGIGRALRVTQTGPGNEAVLIDSLGAPVATSLVVTPGVSAPNAIRALSGTVTGNAIRAILANTSGFAVHASTPGASGSAARAIRAEAFGAATAIEASGVGNVAQNAALRLTMQNGILSGSELAFSGRTGDSTTTTGGRVNYNLTTGTITQSDPIGGGQRDTLTSRGNFISEVDTTSILLVGGVYAVVCTLNLQGMNAPRRAGLRLILRFECEARSIGGAAQTLDVRITDTTAPANVATRQGAGNLPGSGYLLGIATNAWQRPVVLVAPYTIPVAGDRIFTVEIRSASGVPIEVRDASFAPAMPALI